MFELNPAATIFPLEERLASKIREWTVLVYAAVIRSECFGVGRTCCDGTLRTDRGEQVESQRGENGNLQHGEERAWKWPEEA